MVAESPCTTDLPSVFLGDDVARAGDECRVDLLAVLLLRDEVLGVVVADWLPAARCVTDDDALVRRGLADGAQHPLQFVQLQEDVVVHFAEEGKVLAVSVDEGELE